jgi:hypothetical protein
MKIDDLGHWQNESNAPLMRDSFGFVYLIKGLDDYYIGKKQITTKKKLPPLKGKTRNRRVIKEMPKWRSYTGSSESLNAIIDGQYSFHILYIGISKSELSYVEGKLQFDSNCILDNSSHNQQVKVWLKSPKMGDDWKTRYEMALKTTINKIKL